MEETKVVPREEVLSKLEQIVVESLRELEYDLIPHLKHGEAKRLLLATLKYPHEVADFTGEKVELVRAYSASKALKDAMISLGVEVVVDQLVERERKAQENAPASEGTENA